MKSSLVRILTKTPLELSKDEVLQILDGCAQDFPYSIGNPVVEREVVLEKLYTNAYWVLSFDEKNSMVGFIAYYINDNQKFAYIPYCWVNTKFRGQQCGTKMLYEVKRLLLNKVIELQLEVRKDNIGAFGFYLNNGFVIKEDRIEKFLLFCNI